MTEKRNTIRDPYAALQLDAIAARWDAKAEAWDCELRQPDCHLNEDGAYARFLEELGGIIRARQAFCSDEGLIDAGCATGLVLASAISAFAWGLGVDISPRMIDIARGKQIPGARFVVGDCFQLANLCPKAGAVISRGVLLSHYGPKLGVELLASARSSLKDKGFIVWDFLNASARSSFQCAPHNKTYFMADEVCNLAAKAGFKASKVLGESQRRVQLLLAEC